MKKILILLIMFVVVAMLVLGAGVVIAVEQGGEGEVTPDLTLTPSPNPLEFGPMSPKDTKSLPSSLTTGTSNLVVSMITVTSIDGGVFTDGNVMFSENNIDFFSAAEFAPKEIAAETVFDFFVKLSIPVATPSGDFTGVITYTVMEDLTP